MINSLFKDSHITRYSCSQNSRNSRKGATESRGKSATVNHSERVNINKPAEPSFCGFFRSKNPAIPAGIFTNKAVKKFLMLAADQQVVFNAVFSLGLTCLLRPAAIMTMPGDKKNKDDKKYAAAHSIASGVIAYALSLILFSPIGNSLKKIEKDLARYSKNHSNLDYLKNSELMFRAKKYLNMLPETGFSPIKAMLTIALIPPILKCIFGWEKKQPKSKNPQNDILQNYAAINFKNSKMERKGMTSFMGESN